MELRTGVRDERGQILILTALSMTVLLGIAALSIDASYMYDKRNQLYAAADAAAKIGAAEVLRNSAVTPAALKAFGDQQATKNGLTPAACGSTTPGATSVCVHRCDDPAATCAAAFAGNANYVEAVVSQVTNTFFGGVLGFPNATPGARAVAGISNSPNCLISLATGDPGITTDPGSSITGTTCAVIDGGNLHGNNITVQSLGVMPGATSSCNGCTTVAPTLPAPLDPLAALPIPTPADCNLGAPGTDLTVNAVSSPITPGTYGNITFAGGTLTMQPGIYCVTGAVTVTSPIPNVWGDIGGVMIYLSPTASLTLNSIGVVAITLEAQTAGVYRGILFYQKHAAPVVFNGSMMVDGALYFPGATVQMNNESVASSNSCAVIVAESIETVGTSIALENTCPSFGASPIQTISVAE